MNQFCQNCGTRLNGEFYCPKCQRPTGNHESAKTESKPKRRFNARVLSLCLVLGVVAAIAGIGIACEAYDKARIRRENAPYHEAVSLGENELTQRCNAGDEYALYEFGRRIVRRELMGRKEFSPPINEKAVLAAISALATGVEKADSSGNRRLFKETHAELRLCVNLAKYYGCVIPPELEMRAEKVAGPF